MALGDVSVAIPLNLAAEDSLDRREQLMAAAARVLVRDGSEGLRVRDVAVEAGVRDGWDRWIGPDGGFIGMDGFGASAPYKELYREFGITSDAVVKAVKSRL